MRAGQLMLNADNTYSGGTVVEQGTLIATFSGDLGSGHVYVNGVSTGAGGSMAGGVLRLESSNAISDSAILNLTGDSGTDAVIGGRADLGFAIDETVGGLILGGVVQTVAGTYGSTFSTATFQDDRYFTGSGVVTLVPTVIPGDFNGNGAVDAADYVLWRGGGPLLNDPTPGVGDDDYAFWRSRFGVSSPTGSALGVAPQVPEATTASLVAILIIALGALRGSTWQRS